MSSPYSEALMTQPAVLYITYATSSHKQTGNIIIFAQFETGDSVGNERNVAEDKPISASIYGSYADNNSDNGSISMNYLEGI